MRATLVLALAIVVALHTGSAFARHNGCQMRTVNVSTSPPRRATDGSTNLGQSAKCCLEYRAGEGFGAGALVLPQGDGRGRRGERDRRGEGKAALDMRVSGRDEKVQQRSPAPPPPKQPPAAPPHTAMVAFSDYPISPNGYRQSPATVPPHTISFTFNNEPVLSDGQQSQPQPNQRPAPVLPHTTPFTFNNEPVLSDGQQSQPQPQSNQRPAPVLPHTTPFTFNNGPVLSDGHQQSPPHSAPPSFGTFGGLPGSYPIASDSHHPPPSLGAPPASVYNFPVSQPPPGHVIATPKLIQWAPTLSISPLITGHYYTHDDVTYFIPATYQRGETTISVTSKLYTISGHLVTSALAGSDGIAHFKAGYTLYYHTGKKTLKNNVQYQTFYPAGKENNNRQPRYPPISLKIITYEGETFIIDGSLMYHHIGSTGSFHIGAHKFFYDGKLTRFSLPPPES